MNTLFIFSSPHCSLRSLSSLRSRLSLASVVESRIHDSVHLNRSGTDEDLRVEDKQATIDLASSNGRRIVTTNSASRSGSILILHGLANLDSVVEVLLALAGVNGRAKCSSGLIGVCSEVPHPVGKNNETATICSAGHGESMQLIGDQHFGDRGKSASRTGDQQGLVEPDKKQTHVGVSISVRVDVEQGREFVVALEPNTVEEDFVSITGQNALVVSCSAAHSTVSSETTTCSGGKGTSVEVDVGSVPLLRSDKRPNLLVEGGLGGG